MTQIQTRGELVIRHRGLPLLVAMIVFVVLLAATVAMYQRRIDYSADPSTDAMKALAHGDSRFLLVGTPGSVQTLSPGLAQVPLQDADLNRDVRILPPAQGRDSASPDQLRYVTGYNSAMAVMLRRTIAKGQFVRPEPIARSVFTLECLLVALPFILMLHLLYRLGPYRRDGRLWVVCMLENLRFLMPRTYSDEGLPLLRLLWTVKILTVPWILLVVFGVFGGNRPIR